MLTRFASLWNAKRHESDRCPPTSDSRNTNSPQWVIIATWNEWYENTYIEPSVNYND